MALLGGFRAPQAARGSVSIDASYIEAYANDLGTGSFGADVRSFIGTTIPTMTSLDAGFGATHSENDINWAVIGGQTILAVEMDHQRSGQAGVSFQSAAHLNREPSFSHITFAVDTPTPYVLSGFYEVTGASAQTGSARQYSFLSDVNTSQSFFASDRTIQNTTLFVFTLGEPGSGSTGSLTGTLPVGTYRWSFGAGISTANGSDSGATAKGLFQLVLGEASSPGVVPEATSLLIWGVLGLTCCMRGRARA
jgi:hypothetical protein